MCLPVANTAANGGAIVISEGQIDLGEDNTFINNVAATGGALYIEESVPMQCGNIMIQANMAIKGGGGIYLYHSEYC